MITACPHCQTKFQISAEQLGAKAGLVRCGQCRQVFNGYRGLTIASSEPAKAAQTQAPQRNEPSGDGAPAVDATMREPVGETKDVFGVLQGAVAQSRAADRALESVRSEESTPENAEPLLDVAAVPSNPRAAPTDLTTGTGKTLTADAQRSAQESVTPTRSRAATLPDALPPSNPTPRAQAADLLATAAPSLAPPPVTRTEPPIAAAPTNTPRTPEILYKPELHATRPSLAMILGSAALLIALAAQSIFFWRGWIAQRWPETRAMLESVCERFGCDVPYARELSLLNIESSALEADASRPGIFALHASVQNVAPFVQRYPHLELTFTGVNDEVLSVKVFEPREYLPEKEDAARGWAAKQTHALSLYLNASALPPAGFRLRLLYP